MPAKKHKDGEIIGKLGEVTTVLGQGGTTAEACRTYLRLGSNEPVDSKAKAGNLTACSELIATRRLDTSLLPIEQQFDTWASHTPNSRVTPRNVGPFLARVCFWQLDGLIVCENWLDPFEAVRDNALIQATQADHYFLVVMLSGEVRFRAPGVDQLCEKGDALLCDFTRPTTFSTTRQHCLTAVVARNFLEEAAGPVDVHGRLPRAPETRLLADFLRALVQQLPATAPASVVPISRIVRDLLATAVSGLPRRTPASNGAASARARVKRYIEAQPPGTLDVPAMLGALGLTRSTLYRLFEPDGGVLAYDKLRRLRLVHRCLSNPLDQRLIAEIGYAHGFADGAHLAHAFRVAFGYSMSDLRGHLRTNLAPSASEATDAPGLYREGVLGLS